MIKGGYILQPRKIDESDIFKSPPHVREIWLYLLRKANHKDNGEFKKGQLLTSYKKIINDLSWFVGFRKEYYKKHHCEIAMKVLTAKNMITTAKTTRGMIVTICNYEYYQDPKNYENDIKTTTKTTSKRQSNDTINKNDKECKEEKNNILSNIDFLYSLYPTKCLINGSSTGKGKKDKEKLDKLLKKQSKESIEKAIKWYMDDCIKHNRFMKNFSTFLNNIPDIPEENEIIEKEFFVYYQDGQLPKEVPIEEMEKYKTILGPQITHSEIIKKKVTK